MKVSKINIVFSIFLFTFFSCTKAFIDEGETPTTDLDRIVKYDPDIATIMFNHCVTCHGGIAPSGGFTLTSYEEVKAYAEGGTLLSRVNNPSNPMPPSGLLSVENRQIIDKWVADGLLEN